MLPLKTATDRAVRAALSRAGADDDAREASLDAAELAAKERLTRAALGAESWASEVHPWDAAFAAAAGTPGGALWASVQEMTRAAVDEGPWAAGMQAARAVPSTRCCATRPTSWPAPSARPSRARRPGVAARSVALRAAAVARAQGASAEEATQAAEAALGPDRAGAPGSRRSRSSMC